MKKELEMSEGHIVVTQIVGYLPVCPYCGKHAPVEMAEDFSCLMGDEILVCVECGEEFLYTDQYLDEILL